MPVKQLHLLATAILHERLEVLGEWRQRVRGLPSAQGLDAPTLNDHIPGWIAEFGNALATASSMSEEDSTPASPLAHGLQRFEDGFDIEEVVAEYGILRDCVHELAERHGVELHGRARRCVDHAFDQAIAGAVKAFAASQARAVQRKRAEHLAFVAHDLRTPLSAISFAAHLLENRLGGAATDAEIARLLKTLGRNTRQLDALVANVLKENTQLLTELGIQLERRAFDLWPMVEALLQDLQPIATKAGTRMANQVPDDLEVRADAGLLRRIFQNLVANALAYAPRGHISIGARDPGPGLPVECWVSDDGAGIPASRIGKVFDALESDPEREGVGLGLAIVKTFVEAHDGTVSVQSVEGEGCTFFFTLPRSPVVREPHREASEAHAG